jgi:TPR repeat protein
MSRSTLVFLTVIAACGGKSAAPVASAGSSESPLRARCEGGDGPACGQLVKELRKSTARAELELALTLAQRGCSISDAPSCRGVALLHLGGPHAVDMNPKLAAESYRKGCEELKDLDSCQSYGWMQLHGIGLARDVESGARALQQACEADAASCIAYWELMVLGVGMAADAATAIPKLAERCKTRPAACTYVGFAHEQGLAGHAKDPVEAERLYRVACGGMSSEGCLLLGKFLVKSERASEARDPLTLACDRHRAEACALLADTDPKADRAALDRRACQLGLEARCAGR